MIRPPEARLTVPAILLMVCCISGAQLRVASKQLSTIFESSPDSISLLDALLRVLVYLTHLEFSFLDRPS